MAGKEENPIFLNLDLAHTSLATSVPPRATGCPLKRVPASNKELDTLRSAPDRPPGARPPLHPPFRHGQQDHSPLLPPRLSAHLPRFTPSLQDAAIRHRWRVKKEDVPDLLSVVSPLLRLACRRRSPVQIDFALFLRRSGRRRGWTDRPTDRPTARPNHRRDATGAIMASIAIH